VAIYHILPVIGTKCVKCQTVPNRNTFKVHLFATIRQNSW